MDDVQNAFKDVYRDIENDDDLRDFYDDVVQFLNRAIKDKDYVTSDAADNEAHRLYDRSTELLGTKQEHYRPDVEHLFEEIKDYGDAIKNDKANKRVVQVCQISCAPYIVSTPLTFECRPVRRCGVISWSPKMVEYKLNNVY